jgi:DNA replication and repair protein RecF
LSHISLDYIKGWSADAYHDQLRSNRRRDLERGMTMSGPHRADLGLSCETVAARAVLSRGEQKVLAAALLLTQAELLVKSGEHPVILLDDLASEFDRAHFDSVLQRALAIGSQVWVTGTRRAELNQACSVFHVEQGQVREVV